MNGYFGNEVCIPGLKNVLYVLPFYLGWAFFTTKDTHTITKGKMQTYRYLHKTDTLEASTPSLSLSDDGRVRRRRKRRTSERVGVAARLKQQAAALEQCLLDTPSSHNHGDRY